MFKNLKPDRLKIVKFNKKSLPELVRLVFRKLNCATVLRGCHDSILLQKLHDLGQKGRPADESSCRCRRVCGF